MDSEFFFEGKKYISTRKAATLTKYAWDYVGQLCRLGKVDCRKVGKSWYVCQESILKHANLPVTEDCFDMAEAVEENREQEVGSPSPLPEGGQRVGERGGWEQVEYKAVDFSPTLPSRGLDTFPQAGKEEDKKDLVSEMGGGGSETETNPIYDIWNLLKEGAQFSIFAFSATRKFLTTERANNLAVFVASLVLVFGVYFANGSSFQKIVYAELSGFVSLTAEKISDAYLAVSSLTLSDVKKPISFAGKKVSEIGKEILSGASGGYEKTSALVSLNAKALFIASDEILKNPAGFFAGAWESIKDNSKNLAKAVNEGGKNYASVYSKKAEERAEEARERAGHQDTGILGNTGILERGENPSAGVPATPFKKGRIGDGEKGGLNSSFAKGGAEALRGGGFFNSSVFGTIASDMTASVALSFTSLWDGAKRYVAYLIWGEETSTSSLAENSPFLKGSGESASRGISKIPQPPLEKGDLETGKAGVKVEAPRVIVERITEKQIIVQAPSSSASSAPALNFIEGSVPRGSALSREELEEKLNQLNNSLSAKIYTLSATPATGGSYITNVYNTVAQTNRIDKLHTVVITDSTFTGGSISGASVSATGLSVTGTGTSTFSGGIAISSGCFRLPDGTCAGAGGGSGNVGESLLAGSLPYYEEAGSTLSATTTIVISPLGYFGIGTTSPSDTLAINGATYLAPISAPGVATDRIYNVAGNLYWNGADISSGASASWSALGADVYRLTGNVGVGTTSPYAKLSVVGETVSAYFTATTTATSTLPRLSATGISTDWFCLGGVCNSGWPSSASSTLLSDDNTFSGDNIFSNIITGSITGNAGTVTNGVYTTDTGSVTNTMLANSSLTVNGTAISLGGSGTITSASSTLLSDANIFSGVNNFTNAGSNWSGTWQSYSPSSFQTAGSYLTAYDAWTHPSYGGSATSSLLTLTGGLLSTASTTFNNEFHLPALSNGGLAVFGGLVTSYSTSTWTFASSTLLSDTNIWTGGNTFANSTSTHSTSTNLYTSSLVASNSTSTNFYSSSLIASNATSTSLFARIFRSVSGIFSDITTGSLTTGNIVATSSATSTFAGGITSTTGLSASYADFGVGQFGVIVSTSSATSTFAGGISLTAINTTSASSTMNGLVLNGNGLRISTMNCAGLGNGGKLTTDANGNVICGNDIGGGGSVVSTVTNSDGTLTISPTSGDVVVGINLANANSWTGGQTFVNATSTRMFYGVQAYFSSTSIGNITVGSINSTSTATSTFAGGVSTAGLASSQGLVISAGNFQSLGSATSTFAGGLDVLAINQTGTATSTFTNGITLTSGCFRLPNGECAGTGGGATISASPNTLLFTADGTTIISTSSLPLYVGAIYATSTSIASYFGGNVGVGTTSPYARLSVEQGDSDKNVFVVGDEGTSTPSLVVTGRGYVGIGVTTPAYTLDLNGTVRAASNVLGNNFRATGMGSLAIPAYALSTGYTTGLYSPVSYSLGFINNGVETMRLDPSGRLGIATTSPWAMLSVNGTSTQSSFIPLFAVATSTGTATSTAFIIDADGKVGIGTSSPSGTNALSVQGGAYFTGNVGIGTANPTVKLDVSGALTTTGVITGGSNIVAVGYVRAGTEQSFLINNRSKWSSSADGLVLMTNNAGTDFTRLQFGGITSAFPALGRSGTALVAQLADGTLGGMIGIGTTTPWGLLSIAGTSTSAFPNFVISTSTANSTSTAFIIDADGKVGIGTTSPSQELSVAGNGLISGALTVGGNFITNTLRLLGLGGSMLTATDENGNLVTTSTPSVASINATSTTATSTFAGGLSVGNNAGLVVNQIAPANSLTINSSGNVGIGTANPGAYNFNVVGSTYLNGSTNINGILTLAASGNSGGYVKANSGTSLQIYSDSGVGNYVQITDYNGNSTPGRGLTVYDGGLVGISTTSPWAMLSVNGTSTQSSFIPLFAVATSTGTATSTAFIIDSNGKVGIGTTTPSQQLSVQGNGLISGALTVGGNFITNTLRLLGLGGSMLTATDDNGNIVSTSTPTVAAILATSTTATSTFAGGLSVGNNAGFVVNQIAPANSLNINASGNVGIGTANPGSYKLYVNGDSYINGDYSSNGRISLTSAVGDTGIYPFISMSNIRTAAVGNGISIDFTQYVTGGSQKMIARIGEVITDITSTSQYAGDLVFYTAKNATPTEKVRIDSQGRLGIATTSPWAMLSVNGTSTQSSFIPLFAVATSTGTATSTAFIIDSNGNVGVGTTSPSAGFAVAGHTLLGSGLGSYLNLNVGTIRYIQKATTTITENDFAWTIATGTDATPIVQIDTSFGNISTTTINGSFILGDGALTYDGYSGTTTINNLELGSFTFDEDAGAISWVDLPVTANAPYGTVESYSAQMNGAPVLTVFGYADGVGGAATTSVIMGTSSPFATLSLWSHGAFGRAFEVSDNASTTLFTILDGGKIGMGTSSPFAGLSLNAPGGYPAFAVGSSTETQFVIDQNGRVGVGTSSPQANLSVNTTSGQPSFMVGSSTTYFVIDNKGYVGIGKSNPSYALDVTGTIKTSAQIGVNNWVLDQTAGFYFLDNGRDQFTVGGVTSGGAYPWILSSGNGAGYTGGYLSFKTDGSERIRVNSSGLVGIGTTTPNWNLQIASSTKTFLTLSDMSAGTDAKHWFTSSMGGNFYIGTSSDALNATSTYLTINGGTGKVGIGTAAPSTLLHLSSSAVTNLLTLSDTSNSGNNLFASANSITMQRGNGSAAGFNIGTTLLSGSWGTGGGFISFSPNGTEGMRILNGGNVGIGTTSPASKLSIDMGNGTGLGFYLAGNSNSSADLFRISTSTASATSTAFVIDSNGKVAIGKGTASYELDVQGTINTTALLVNGSTLTSSQWTTSGSNIYYSGGLVGIGSTSPWARLSVEGTSTPALSNLPLFVVGTSTESATSTAFVIDANGNLGIGTTSPSASLSVAGHTLLGSGLGSYLNLNVGTIRYIQTATTIIPQNTPYAWTMATGTSATPIITIDTTSTPGAYATTTIYGGFVLDDGALTYDSSSGITSISGLQTGPMNFEDDLGAISWVDMGVTSASSWGDIMSYTAHINSNPILTVFGVSDGAGNIIATSTAVGIGTTTPYAMLDILAGSTTPHTTGFTRNYDAVAIANQATSSSAGVVKTGLNIQSTGDWTGASAKNIGLYVSSVTGGTNNYDAIFNGGGAVGIGTTTPLARLSVVGTLGSQSDLFNISSTTATDVTSSLFRVAANGNVGVGTTTPSANLSVNTTSGQPAFMVGSSTTYFVIDNKGYVGIGVNSPAYPLDVSGDIRATNGGRLISITSAVTTLVDSASITNTASLTMKSGSLADLIFNTGSNERMRILSNGNVGLGTTTPAWNLQIASSTKTFLTLSDMSAGDNAKHWFTSSMGGNFYIGTSSDALNATSTYLTINQAGNVGIGTTNITATYALDVNGSIRSANAINAVGSVYSGNGTYYLGSTGNLRTATIYDTGSTRLVGIGSSTPSSKLSIEMGNGTGLGFYLAGNSNSTADLFRISTSTAVSTSTAFVIDSNGKVAIGKATASYSLDVAGSINVTGNFLINGSAAATQWTTSGGNIYYTGGLVGIGSTSPWARLSVEGTSTPSLSNLPLFVVGTSTASATSTAFIIDKNGRIGQGTTSPYAEISTAGLIAGGYYNADNANATSTFLGGFDLGDGALQYDFSSQEVSIDSLSVGAMNFEDDAGQVSWADMGVTTDSPWGTYLSYTANLQSNPILTVFAVSDGIGGIIATSTGVGIGTTTPMAMLDIFAGSTTPFTTGWTNNYDAVAITNHATSSTANVIKTGLNIQSTGDWTGASAKNIGLYVSSVTGGALNYDAIFNGSGMVGIGTSTPWANLSISATTTSQTTPLFAVSTTTSGYPTAFIIDQNGNVGIGTSSPSARLSIGQISNNIGLYLAGSSGNTSDLFRISTSTADATFTAFAIDSNGKVGIGTTSPYLPLSVSGGAAASYFNADNAEATSTFAGDISVSGLADFTDVILGPLSFDTDAGAVDWITMPLASGIGAQSFSAKIANTDILTVYGNGNGSGGMNYYGVGIGNATPTYFLDVAGNGRFTSYVDASYFVATSSTATSTFAGALGIGTTSPWGLLSVGGGVGSGIPAFLVSTSSSATTSTAFIIDSNGNVGVGTTSNALGTQFAVEGNTYTAGNAYVNGKVGIGTSSPRANLSVNTTSGQPAFMVGSSTTYFVIDKSGNVGVGTANPGSALSFGGGSVVSVATQDASDNGSLEITGSGAADYSRGAYISLHGNEHANKGSLYLAAGQGDDSDTAGQIIFYTSATGGGALNQQMTIMNSPLGGTLPRIGVGTSSPMGSFTVAPDTIEQVLSVNVDGSSPSPILTVYGGMGGKNLLDIYRMMGGNRTDGLYMDSDSRLAIGTTTIDVGTRFIISNNLADTNILSMYDSGGINRLSVLDTGNVGIGTTSPWGNLSIHAPGGSTPSLIIGSSTYASATSTAFIVNGEGRVGIGTSTPGALLTINNQGTIPSLYIADSADDATPTIFGADGKLYLGGRTTTNGTNVQLVAGQFNSAISVPSQMVFGDYFGTAGTGNAYPRFVGNWPSSNIWGVGPHSGSADNQIRIGTTANTASVWTAVRTDPTILNVSGGLAIGTSTPWGMVSIDAWGVSPKKPIFVIGATGTSSPLFIVESNRGWIGLNTTTPSSRLSIDANSTGMGGLYIAGVFNGEASLLNISTSTQGATSTAFIIDSNGKVGIGTSSPSGTNALAVQGQSYFAGNVGIGDNNPSSKLSVIGTTTATTLSLGSNAILLAPTNGTHPGTIALNDSTVNSFGMGLGEIRNSKYDIWQQTGAVNGGGYRWYIGTTEKMTMDYLGNVGIGTTTPYAPLTIEPNSTSNNNNSLVLSNKLLTANRGIGTAIDFRSQPTGQDANFSTGRIVSQFDGNLWSTARIAIQSINGADGTYIDTLNLKNGNVGIGTTTPYTKLELVGSAQSYVNSASVAFSDSFNQPNSRNWLVGNAAAGNYGDLTFAVSSDANGLPTNPKMTIDRNGNVGIGTTSPFSRLSVSGDTWLDSNILRLGSTTASGLIIAHQISATSTIVSNKPYAWSLATGTDATPIITIDTTVTGGAGATTTINGGLVIDGGALTYDYSGGYVSINSLQTGPMNFDTDAGQISWIDLPVSGALYGTPESYTAHVGGTPVLSVFGYANGIGGVATTSVLIGTSTPFAKLSLWSDDVFGTAGTAFEIANTASTTLFKVMDSGTISIGTSTATTTIMGYLNVAGTGDHATSTIAGNLYVYGTIRAGANTYTGDLFFANNFSITEQLPIGTTTMQALLLKNQFGSTTLAINENGYLGLGTTSPEYRLHVIGDVAAESFVNISTREAKKDISYLSESDKGNVLEKIRTLGVATYNYTNEESCSAGLNSSFTKGGAGTPAEDLNPSAEDGHSLYERENGDPTCSRRLGLIAEESPSEILSASGKGVDLYKMSTFILAGLQAEDKRITALETKMADIEAKVAALMASSHPPSVEGGLEGGGVQSVLNYLASLGSKITAGVAEFKNVISESLTVGSSATPSGITLFDEVTKQPYCFKMSGGVSTTTPGACLNSSFTKGGAGTPAEDLNPSAEDGHSLYERENGTPIITLMGNNPATIDLRSTYADLGATAFATSTDGTRYDIMVDTVGNTVDTSVAGEYTVTYTARSRDNVIATSTRSVIVINPQINADQNADSADDTASSATTTPAAPSEASSPATSIPPVSDPSSSSDPSDQSDTSDPSDIATSTPSN